MEKTKSGITLSFLHLGVFIALVIVVIFGFVTAFDVIDYLAPSDQLDWHLFSRQIDTLPESSAFLAVAFGVLLLLSRRLRTFSVVDYRGTVWFSFCHAIFSLILALSVTIVAVSLSLFLGEVLSGTASLGEVFKTLFAAGVGAMIFYYYRGVSRDIWHLHVSEERFFVISSAVLVSLLVFVAVVVVNPFSRTEVRTTYETLEIVSAASNDVHWFFRKNGYLPASLDAEAFLRSDDVVRQHDWEPHLGDRFTYKRTGRATYEICASFDALPRGTAFAHYPYERFEVEEIGEQCFALDALSW